MIRRNEQTGSRWRMATLGVLGLMTAMACAHTFGTPSVFDHIAGVLGNPSIHAWREA